MHIAITKRKFDFSHLEDTGGRIPKEDLITSMLFGTLQYLPAAEVVRFLATALRTPTAPEEVREVLVPCQLGLWG
jgi:hypothetical protein